MDQINRPEYEALRAVLSEAMASAGIGQRELSRKLGKPHVYIFRVLAGKRTLEFSELLDICDGIGANPTVVFKEAITRSRASI